MIPKKRCYQLPLSPEALTVLCRYGHPQPVAKGHSLIKIGDLNKALYVILQGHVEVALHLRGRETYLTVHTAGEIVGDITLLDDQPQPLSAVAVEACELQVLSRSAFCDCMRDYPEILWQLFGRMNRHCRILLEGFSYLQNSTVYDRVVHLLSKWTVYEDGVGLIPEPVPTHDEIARRVIASREMVSRVFKMLRDEDYIAPLNGVRGPIRVLKPLPTRSCCP